MFKASVLFMDEICGCPGLDKHEADLLALFYFIFAPMGVVMRIFGIDALDRKIDRGRGSYWKKKEKKEFSLTDYERQF